jgi:uncharacterized Zn-binding protein involved in type VI secretion
MPEAARFSVDKCDGNCPANTPELAQTHSPNVYVNGLNILRQSDNYLPHTAIVAHLGRFIAVGSGTVYVNGKQAARKADAISCGAKIATGSSNVFIGG